MQQSFSFKRLTSYVIIAAIAFIFVVQFGPASRGCDAQVAQLEDDAAAKVNGVEVPRRELERAYQGELQALRRRSPQFDDDLARQLGLPQQILDRMINQLLLSQAAGSHGIRPSRRELARRIRETAAFHEDGQFSFERYQSTIRDFYGTSVTAYEEDLEEDLSAQRLLQLVSLSAHVADDDVQAAYRRSRNSAKVTFVRFLPQMYAQQGERLSDRDVQRFIDENPEELAEAYEENAAAYERPAEVRLRHLLIRFPKDAGEAERAEAAERVAELRASIEGGKSFEEVTKEHSDDAETRSRGGDLGWRAEDGLAPVLTPVAFGLEVGELSEPIVGEEGVHLLKLEERRDAEVQPLEEVQAELARSMLQKQRARERALQAAERTLTRARGGQDLTALHPVPEGEKPAIEQFRTESEPQAVETAPFTAASGTVPFLGAAPEVRSAIFDKQAPGLIERLVPLDEGWAVVHVDERELPTDEGFASERESLTEQLRLRSGNARIQAYLDALEEAADVFKSPNPLPSGRVASR